VRINEKLRFEISEVRRPKGIVTIDPKGTRVRGFSAAGKKKRKVERLES
jgi:hypothetical protein